MKNSSLMRLSLLLSVCAGMAAGCKTVPAGQPPGQQLEQPAKQQDDYVTATLFSDVGFWQPPAWDTTPGTITGEITKRTGLALDIEIPPQEADTQLKLMLLKRELPDIISITDETLISQLVTSKAVWDLEEFLTLYCPDSHLLQVFPADIKQELIKRDGGWYAFPSHMNSEDARAIWKSSSAYYDEVVNYNDNNAMIWNRQLLAQAGLSVEALKTQEQVLNAFAQVQEMNLTTAAGEVIILLPDGKDYQDPTLKFLLNTFGAEWVDHQGNVRDIYLHEEAKDALAFLNQVIRKGYCEPEHLTLDNPKIKELIASGRVLCFIGNIANTDLDGKDWVSAGPILPASGKTPVLGKNRRAPAGWMGTFISRDCRNPEAIARWLDFMSGAEGMTLGEFGFAGIHYEVDEDGLYHRTSQGRAAKEAYQETGVDAWWPFHNMAWRRSVSPYPEAGSSEALYDELTKAYGISQETVIYDDSLLMFPSNFIPADSELGKIQKEIDTQKRKSILTVILAADDQEFELEYSRFMEALNALSIHKLDEKRNAGYQYNCSLYHSKIEKIN